MKFKLLTEAKWKQNNLNYHYAKHVLNLIDDPTQGHDSRSDLMYEFGYLPLLAKEYGDYTEAISNAKCQNLMADAETEIKPNVVYGCMILFNGRPAAIKVRMSPNDSSRVDLVAYNPVDGFLKAAYRLPISKLQTKFIKKSNWVGILDENKPKDEKPTDSSEQTEPSAVEDTE